MLLQLCPDLARWVRLGKDVLLAGGNASTPLPTATSAPGTGAFPPTAPVALGGAPAPVWGAPAGPTSSRDREDGDEPEEVPDSEDQDVYDEVQQAEEEYVTYEEDEVLQFPTYSDPDTEHAEKYYEEQELEEGWPEEAPAGLLAGAVAEDEQGEYCGCTREQRMCCFVCN